MKKITTNGRSFGTAQSLTRQQLKNVMGGDWVTSTNPRPSCKVTTAAGYNYTLPDYMCTNIKPNQCQTAADAWCLNNNACADVDCPGATV